MWYASLPLPPDFWGPLFWSPLCFFRVVWVIVYPTLVFSFFRLCFALFPILRMARTVDIGRWCNAPVSQSATWNLWHWLLVLLLPQPGSPPSWPHFATLWDRPGSYPGKIGTKRSFGAWLLMGFLASGPFLAGLGPAHAALGLSPPLVSIPFGSAKFPRPCGPSSPRSWSPSAFSLSAGLPCGCVNPQGHQSTVGFG